MNVDLTRLRAWGLRLLDVVPGVRLALDDLIRVEFIDRMVVVAAQSLFALVPLFVVIAAFSPEVVRDNVLSQVADVMAVQGSALEAVESAMSAEQIRTQTGLVGLAVVLLSATSYARALQRMYERAWKQPHIGGLPGMRRSFVWIVGCVAYLEVLTLVLAALSVLPGAGLWRLVGQVAAGTALWWWTPYVLLQGRERWRNLLPGALLTSVALAALTRLSEVLMPAYVTANVSQFGALGLVFAASTWLLVFGGVLVVACVLGRVAVVEPRLNSWYEAIAGRVARRFARRHDGGPTPGGGHQHEGGLTPGG
jgi:membrane protein